MINFQRPAFPDLNICIRSYCLSSELYTATALVCSKRSDSGAKWRKRWNVEGDWGEFLLHRCYFFALLFSSHRSSLSERLERATTALEVKQHSGKQKLLKTSVHINFILSISYLSASCWHLIVKWPLMSRYILRFWTVIIITWISLNWGYVPHILL